jgi:hypothetical protein
VAGVIVNDRGSGAVKIWRLGDTPRAFNAFADFMRKRSAAARTNGIVDKLQR